MSKLKILIAGDPVLRQKAQEVERMDKKTLRLLDDMAETMYAANGVGLAAPQIGVLKRIVVIDVGEQIVMTMCQLLLAGTVAFHPFAERDDGIKLGCRQVGFDIEAVQDVPLRAVLHRPRFHCLLQQLAGKQRV